MPGREGQGNGLALVEAALLMTRHRGYLQLRRRTSMYPEGPNDPLNRSPTGQDPSFRLPASFRTCTPMDGRHFRCRARLRSSSLPGIVLMMSVGGLGLARGGTGANSRVRAPTAGPSNPSAELQRRAGPSAVGKLSWAESVLLWAVMEMRGGAWLPGMGGGAFLKLKAAARNAKMQRVRNPSRQCLGPTTPHPYTVPRSPRAATYRAEGCSPHHPSTPEGQAICPRSHSTAVAGA